MKNCEVHIKKYETEHRDQQPWFQDEMRFGTRSIAQRKWTAQGHRPSCEMKYGYKYRYLFQAIQPSTGKTFEMYLSNMDGPCFKTFINEFAKKHPNQTMIMDNAGCHHVEWEDGQKPNVKIEYLSPYSPDFNPQERMFQEIKKPLKGKIFDSVEQIGQEIDRKLRQFWAQPDSVKRLTAWDWII